MYLCFRPTKTHVTCQCPRSLKFSPLAEAVQQGNISCNNHLSTHSRAHHQELRERNNQPKTTVKRHFQSPREINSRR